jgi:hypothetical protein
VHLEHLECRLNQVSQVLSLSLTVVNLVPKVVVADLEQIQHRQYLSIVWNQCLTDGVTARDQCLKDLECDSYDFRVAGVQCSYN